MSEPAAALAPTLSNFEAIIARNEAKISEADSGGDDSPSSPFGGSDDASDDQPEREERAQSTEQDDDAQDSDESSDEGPGDEEVPIAASDVEPAPYKALREAKKAGRVTPELMAAIGDLPLEVPMPDGTTAEFRLDELPKHIMREARFHRELAKTREDQQRAQNIIGIERQRTQSWQQDPAQLYRGLLTMGCERSLEAVFWHMVEEKHAYESASPQERQRIDYMRQVQKQRAQEQAEVLELKRQLEAAQKQQPRQLDDVTQQTAKYIESNMDKAIQHAFKAAGIGGAITNDERGTFVRAVIDLGERGYQLPDAIQEAAGLVADRFREIRERSRAERARQEKTKPRELSGKRPPSGPAQARDPDNGQFRGNNNKRTKGKPPPTAAEFARRMGLT